MSIIIRDRRHRREEQARKITVWFEGTTINVYNGSDQPITHMVWMVADWSMGWLTANYISRVLSSRRQLEITYRMEHTYYEVIFNSEGSIHLKPKTETQAIVDDRRPPGWSVTKTRKSLLFVYFDSDGRVNIRNALGGQFHRGLVRQYLSGVYLRALSTPQESNSNTPEK